MRTKVLRKVLDYPAKGGPLPAGANRFMGKNYMKNPPLGLGQAAAYTLGIASSLYMTDYSQKYGGGFAIMHGIASTAPHIWAPMAVAELGIEAMSYGYDKYHQRRTLNLGRPMADSYGTINAMKMHSLHKMQRGHNSMSRGLGNEARHMHT